MQFLGKNWPNNRLAPPPLELATSGKKNCHVAERRMQYECSATGYCLLQKATSHKNCLPLNTIIGKE